MIPQDRQAHKPLRHLCQGGLGEPLKVPVHLVVAGRQAEGKHFPGGQWP